MITPRSMTSSPTRQGLRVTPTSGLGVTSASALHVANRCLLACRRTRATLSEDQWGHTRLMATRRWPFRTAADTPYGALHQYSRTDDIPHGAQVGHAYRA